MPKVILKRLLRHGGVLQQKGTALDVDQETADRLLASGAAELDTPETSADQSGSLHDSQPEAVPETVAAEPAEVEAVVAEITAEPVAEAAEVPAPQEPVAPAGQMKRPAKGKDLATWQAYTQSQGVDPKGKTREELIAMWT